MAGLQSLQRPSQLADVVASVLDISIKTAMSHREHVMLKLQVHNRTELVRFALQQERQRIDLIEQGDGSTQATLRRIEQRRRLVAVEAYCYYNSGAYGDTTPNLITRGYAAAGPYRVPNLLMDSYGVYTNTAPSAAFRGYGITQVVWAHESQMDIIGDGLGIDPLDLRLKNVLQKGDSFSTGEPMPEMHYTELLEAAAEKIGWKDTPIVIRDGNKIRAKGISAIVKGMATPTTSTANVKLNADGSLNVLTSSVEMGQGLKTALAQITASEIELPVERVRISEPDTSLTPFDLMTAASRATFCMGTAIRRGVEQVKEQLLESAATLL